jgi:hypothetical protein
MKHAHAPLRYEGGYSNGTRPDWRLLDWVKGAGRTPDFLLKRRVHSPAASTQQRT